MSNADSEISPLMQGLSSYIASGWKQDLPGDVAEKARQHVLDTLASMVSGAKLVPGEKAVHYARLQGGVAEAVVAGSDVVTSAVNAALANGMTAHADETDDSHPESFSHPGCGVVPAALAMAERGESGPGRMAEPHELLAAIELASMGPRHPPAPRRGFSP
mgnify:CR=1 FL=1